jgi:signal recognition particle subunit SRP9
VETRYSVKWRSSEGKLVLKITDDVTVRFSSFQNFVFDSLEDVLVAKKKKCLKFKTHSSIFLGRFEALNRSLIQKMMNVRPPSITATATPVASTALSTPQAQSAAISPVTQGSNLPSTPTTSTGGGVKKKKGKKK